MSQAIKTLGKQGAVYGLGTLLTRGLGFFLIPLYTHYLSPQDYGMLEMLDLTGTIISFFIAMGITNSILRFHGYYTEAKDKEEVISTALIFAITSGGIMALILAAFSETFSNIIFRTTSFSLYFKLVFVNIYLAQVHTHCKTIFRVKGLARSFTYVSVGTTLLSITLNIFFIAVLKMGITGLYYSSIITFSTVTSVLLIRQFLKIRITFSFHKLSTMLRYGVFFIPTLLITFVTNFSDRYFLRAFTDLETVGIYALGYKLGMIVVFLIGFPFQQVWGAYAFEIEKQDDAPKVFSKVLTYYTLLAVFVALSFSVLSKEIVQIMADSAYFEAYTVIPMIALSAVFYSADNVIKIGILIKKKTAYLPLINGLVATLNIGLNILLIPKYGMYGAAIATVISFSSLPVMTLWISQRMYPVQYEIARLFKIVLVASLLYYLSRLIPMNNLLVSIALKSSTIVSFPIILYIGGFFTDEEKSHISVFMSKINFRFADTNINR